MQTSVQSLKDPRWKAVIKRDARADGHFYFAVKTTGVYCRPACAARTPKPENVRFFDTQDAAEQAGFRACKRCKPRGATLAEEHATLVTQVCGWIEANERMPVLAALAKQAKVSPWHLHRVFKAVTGVTPRAYAAALRAQRVRGALTRGAAVTQAMYGAGFNSSGRFYEKSNAILGMTPGQYRAGGAATGIRYAHGACSLGVVLVGATERGVCAILLGDSARALLQQLHARFPRAQCVAGGAAFQRTVKRVVRLVENPARGITLSLDVRGTAFQQRVWQALQAVPAGSTISYSDLAQRIGAPKAVRAVAGACAAYALAVAIPCHRALRADGGLAGYRWGVARKRALLAREGNS